jgi:predicted CXXCH cytochrome family protein
VKRLKKQTALLATTIAGAALVGLIVSCATIDRVVVAPPMIPGATYLGMDNCAICHEKESKDFKLTHHSRLRLRNSDGEEVEGLGCEACHGPGSLHVDAGGGKGKFIVNPDKDPSVCFQCHLETDAQFSLQHRHPVKEGRMTCSDCHNAHGEDIHNPKGIFVARVNESCAKCHREQARPRVFEHEAMREGCVTCHNVHGSINDKLLTERDNNLCLKCHAQVAATPGTVNIGKMPHAGFGPTEFLKQGTCYSAGCHTAVHGSDINTHLRY